MPRYDDVPDVDPDAVVDPHWQALLQPNGLPAAYLPPSMPGEQPRWRKVSAVVVLVGLVTATAGGVCLTYGPGELFRLLS